MDYNKVSDIFRQLALAAGEEIMAIYNNADFSVEIKSDSSPVTAADLAADKSISAGLRSAFPQTAIVTEEQSLSHGHSSSTFIIVDPLDGTKEFIQRRGDFTVNIALIENGIPTRGVVYAPARNRLFWTASDGQSFEETPPFLTENIGKTKAMHVRKPDNSALTVVASKSHRDTATDDYIALYNVKEFNSAGSSLKFCLVAAGEADVYPRLGRTMEWDTAAGHAVLLGAGGYVARMDDFAPLAYGKPSFENPFFIAHGPGVALKAIQK